MRLGLCVVALVLSWTHLAVGSRGIKGKRQRRSEYLWGRAAEDLGVGGTEEPLVAFFYDGYLSLLCELCGLSSGRFHLSTCTGLSTPRY